MTPVDVNTAARDLYNATGDSFFTDLQIYNWMWQACHKLAMEAELIERIYTANTVASQQDYAYPTNTIKIKRITVNGKKIKRITHRQDDAITLSNSTSISSGIPIYYSDFNFTISLRPLPDNVYPIKIYSFNDAQPITATSVLEIPTLFHMDLVNFVVAQMYLKDKDMMSAQFFLGQWAQNVLAAKKWQRLQKRGDSFATVQDEETLPVTILGEA